MPVFNAQTDAVMESECVANNIPIVFFTAAEKNLSSAIFSAKVKRCISIAGSR